MTTPHRSTRSTTSLVTRSTASAAALALLLVLTGCGPSTARPAPVTDVSWEDGAPAGGLEDDPAAMAVRASQLAEAAAVNARDFRLPELASSTTVEAIALYYANYDSTGPEVFYGPRPGVVTAIEEDGDTFLVHVCGSSLGWRWSTSPDGPHYDPADAVETTYTVVGGATPKVGHVSFTQTPCEGASAALGLFDPQPQAPSAEAWRDVLLPDGVERR